MGKARDRDPDMLALIERIKQLATRYAELYGSNVTLQIDVDIKSKSAILKLIVHTL